MARHKRYRVFADLKVQGTLCVRLIVYWCVCIGAVVGTMVVMTSLTGGGQDSDPEISPLRFVAPGMTVAFLILPLVLFDLLVFSNRFAGPMVRFRSEAKRLANGEAFREIHFRHGDYYQDVAADMNQAFRQRNQLTFSDDPETGFAQEVFQSGERELTKV